MNNLYVHYAYLYGDSSLYYIIVNFRYNILREINYYKTVAKIKPNERYRKSFMLFDITKYEMHCVGIDRHFLRYYTRSASSELAQI